MESVVNELKDKMSKLFPMNTQVAVVDSIGEVKYIDPALESERLKYIKEYVTANFELIELNQYSLPLSGVLLGFFKISEKVMLILYAPTGKIGNLLAYRGIVDSFTAKIEETLDLMQEIFEMETLAYDVIRLKKVKAIQPTAGPAIAIDTAEVATPVIPKVSSPSSIFPKLDPKYSKKKFAFKEGLCLQFADGKNSIEDISEKCNFSNQEVLEIIDKYQKKGWIEIIYKE